MGTAQSLGSSQFWRCGIAPELLGLRGPSLYRSPIDREVGRGSNRSGYIQCHSCFAFGYSALLPIGFESQPTLTLSD